MVPSLTGSPSKVETAAPTRVVLHVPYFVTVTQVDADYPGLIKREAPAPTGYPSDLWAEAPEAKPRAYVEFPANTTELTIEWQLDEGEQLNYETAVERWKARYAAAYDRFIVGGGEPLVLDPVPLR